MGPVKAPLCRDCFRFTVSTTQERSISQDDSVMRRTGVKKQELLQLCTCTGSVRRHVSSSATRRPSCVRLLHAVCRHAPLPNLEASGRVHASHDRIRHGGCHRSNGQRLYRTPNSVSMCRACHQRFDVSKYNQNDCRDANRHEQRVIDLLHCEVGYHRQQSA